MFGKILSCFWLPVLLIIVSIINIIKPFKMKGALLIKGSYKNEDTWNFTQRIYSSILLGLSFILFVIACIIYNKALAAELSFKDARHYIGWIAFFVVLIPVPFTKLALVTRYDKEGKKKKKKKKS